MQNTIQAFLKIPDQRAFLGLPALSIFSGAGLSDLGYELAGFKYFVQCELDKHRANIGAANFPNSKWLIGDIRETCQELIEAYRTRSHGARLALLTLTPPCQGMSSSNPGRGKISIPAESDNRNTLLLEALPVIAALKPRVVVAENVAPLLNRIVNWKGKTKTIAKLFASELPAYDVFAGVVEMADYGIPQMRKRSIVVAVCREENALTAIRSEGLLPWPRPTHALRPMLGRRAWISLAEWLRAIKYPELDARSHPSDLTHPLHFVPAYSAGDRRYEMISNIPPHTGQNAYSNSICLACGRNGIPPNLAYCPHCDNVLVNRPVTKAKNGRWRLIRGFESSYRRAASHRPAPTVTTNSSHLGSDNKIHPWEHRVFSILECADLQTVPRFVDWTWALSTGHSYVIRNAVGEALPPYFTYLHGQLLANMLQDKVLERTLARQGVDGQDRSSIINHGA